MLVVLSFEPSSEAWMTQFLCVCATMDSNCFCKKSLPLNVHNSIATPGLLPVDGLETCVNFVGAPAEGVMRGSNFEGGTCS